LDDEAMADLYQRAKDAMENGTLAADPERRRRVEDELGRIANAARDPHLRANASLLLGASLEARGDRRQAIAFYRHAAALVPSDAGPRMALALALAADGRPVRAANVQRRVIELDPDNLENFLVLGEMLLQAGDNAGATEAYAAYEVRRKGLIDGLTLKRDGEYEVDAVERAECALALAAASDNGTALALLYALGSDPDPGVRVAIARTMGIQRLRGYRKPLEEHLEREKDADVREAVTWALSEIARDPVDSRPATTPGAEAARPAQDARPGAAGEKNEPTTD
jgi:tetratricopeptide (TPR) repeat protein